MPAPVSKRPCKRARGCRCRRATSPPAGRRRRHRGVRVSGPKNHPRPREFWPRKIPRANSGPEKPALGRANSAREKCAKFSNRVWGHLSRKNRLDKFRQDFGRVFGPFVVRPFVRSFGLSFGRNFGRLFGRDFGRVDGPDHPPGRHCGGRGNGPAILGNVAKAYGRCRHDERLSRSQPNGKPDLKPCIRLKAKTGCGQGIFRVGMPVRVCLLALLPA
jgi:hypothetical protein